MPAIIDRDGCMIAGHARAVAADKEGLAAIPVVRLEHLTEAEARSLMVADNKLTDMSRWDEGLLAENFRLLTVEGIDLDLEATGFARQARTVMESGFYSATFATRECGGRHIALRREYLRRNASQHTEAVRMAAGVWQSTPVVPVNPAVRVRTLR